MSFVDLWHIMTFEALTSGTSDCFCLVPCVLGETPTVAIAMFNKTRGAEPMPLFVAITNDMELTLPDMRGSSSGAGRGGPERDVVKRQFAVNAYMTEPSPKHG